MLEIDCVCTLDENNIRIKLPNEHDWKAMEKTLLFHIFSNLEEKS